MPLRATLLAPPVFVPTRERSADSRPPAGVDPVFTELLKHPLSDESRRRLLILQAAGPGMQRALRTHLNLPKLQLAAAAVGSSLKGYAVSDSDIDFIPIILGGTSPDHDLSLELSPDQRHDVFEVLNKQLRSVRPNGATWLTPIPDCAHIEARWQMSRVHYQRDPATMIQGTQWYAVFLPLAFGDRTAREHARKSVIRVLAGEQDGEALWEVVRREHRRRFEINATVVATKPHARAWVRAHGGSEDSLRAFSARHLGTHWLPSLVEMKKRYGIAG